MKKVMKCNKCGLVIEVLAPENATNEVLCCGVPMVAQTPNTSDGATEKHVPCASGDSKGTKVVVGSIAHPMDPDHYIMWIEVKNGQYSNRYYLKPGDKPQAEFYVPFNDNLEIYAYCNKHGLWKNR